MRWLGWGALALAACNGDSTGETGRDPGPQCLPDGEWELVQTATEESDALCSESSTVIDHSSGGTLTVPCPDGCTCADDTADDCTYTLSQTCVIGANTTQTDCSYVLQANGIAGTCTKQQTGEISITCQYDVVGTPQ
jgi:hypothetical protein